MPRLAGLALVGVLAIALSQVIAADAAILSRVAETTISVKEACDGPVIDPEVVVKDQAGNVITETAVGTQVSIEGTVIMECIDHHEDSRITLFEVRTKEGITTFLAWQRISEYSDGQIIINQSWTPDMPGEYEARLFSPVCLRCPMVLTNVASYEITVV